MRVTHLVACSLLLALAGCADGSMANKAAPVANADLGSRLRMSNDPSVKVNSGTEYKLNRQTSPQLQTP